MNSPRTKRFGKFLLVLFALACILTMVVFAEGDEEVKSRFFGTAWSLLPPGHGAHVLCSYTWEDFFPHSLGVLLIHLHLLPPPSCLFTGI